MASNAYEFEIEAPSPGQAPLVSVIVPFLNCEPFIAETVASIAAQTYSNWEILLIDDGSTDGSTELARQFAARDPARIHYLEHDGHANRGASASRNLGLRHARGPLVALLDADDVWLPRKLEEQIAILEAHPEASMVYGFTEYWYSWTGQPEDQGKDYVPGLGFQTDRLYQAPSMYPPLFFRMQSTTPCTCSILVRRDAIDRIGGFDDRFLRIFTDQAFYAKLFLTEPVYVASGCWDRYRQHPDSCCRIAERAGRIAEARRTFMFWLEGYLREQGQEGTPIWRGMQRAMLAYRRPFLHRVVGAAETVAFAPGKVVAALKRRVYKTGQYDPNRSSLGRSSIESSAAPRPVREGLAITPSESRR